MTTLPPTLDEWLAHCERLHPQTIELGLDRARAVAQRMALHFDVPVFTVAENVILGDEPHRGPFVNMRKARAEVARLAEVD